MVSSGQKPIKQAFRPRARVLQLLGDELIGNARLAVFELVKNAYDADANNVIVSLDLRRDRPPMITVSDDGEGMSLETLTDVWMVPGDDHRRKQREATQRTRKHHRLPLGEKGLGRFAVHKLGNRITLVTKAAGEDECVVDIDWNELIAKPFLDEAKVSIQQRTPQVFKGRSTGTRIEIRELRQKEWTRGDVRRLQKQIVSICSPFHEPSGFAALLEILGQESWIADLPDATEILRRAIWKFSFKLDGDKFDWKYEFRQIPGVKLEGRKAQKRGDALQLPPPPGPVDAKVEKKVVADKLTTDGIGPISGEFYVYDREREVLKKLTNVQILTEYLDENGGVRLYRDGIRVYNYGEPGDDWLGLDLRRVNRPTRGISTNIILGAIHLSLEASKGLVEKTNREGFVENDECDRLRRVVLGALGAFEAERQIDKARIRELTAPADDPVVNKVDKPIAELRQALDKQGVREKFEPFVAQIEHDFKSMQETLLTAGMSGLNLAVVFHEVERGVRALHQAITEGAKIEDAAKQARDLMHLLDGFSTLLKRDSRSKHSARKLIDNARRFNLLRLSHHRIQLTCPLLEDEKSDFEAKFAFGLVLGALNNLIDNSLYWMRVRWSELPKEGKPSPRKLFLGTSTDFEAGPAIIIADTGPGFQDEPQNLVRPFFTRKPTGMGLGLYYANLAMELNGGELFFPDRNDVDIPEEFDGAVVAMIFKK